MYVLYLFNNLKGIAMSNSESFGNATSKTSQTIEGYFFNYLYQHGLFEEQAKSVLDAYKTSLGGESMKGRWNDTIDGYPNILLATIRLGVNHQAVQWIDANCPQHWARLIFTGELNGLEPKSP